MMFSPHSSECIGSWQRAAILASPLHQLAGFYLTVDCRSSSCGGERAFAITELAAFYNGRTGGERSA
jgi:hypothetical protein